MTARRCFNGKVASGSVSEGAGQQINDMLDDLETQYRETLGDGGAARQAALDAAEIAEGEAKRKAQLLRENARAQARVLRAVNAYDEAVQGLRADKKAPLWLRHEDASTLGAALRSLLARDPGEVAVWNNVHALARDLRGRAHAEFAQGIDYMRAKLAGFKGEAAREAEVLSALFGRQDVAPEARAIADAWRDLAERLRLEFVDAGGALPHRDDWLLPNPGFDHAKVEAMGWDRFAEFVRANIRRDRMLDFETGRPLTDARFEILMRDAFDAIIGRDMPAPAGARARRMLANRRDLPRLFVWKDAEAWQAAADAFGLHASPYETMLDHISRMTDETAQMRVLGPNPDATRRFALDLYDRERGRLAKAAPEDADARGVRKRTVKARARNAALAGDRKLTEALFAEVTGENRSPVNVALATRMADFRSLLVSSQMGSAIISSITDPGLAVITARMNGLPAMNVLRNAAKMMAEPGSEIFAAQTGLVADTLAHVAGETDRVMGETIRTGVAAKLASGVIRASGLRRWTAVLRNAFALEMMAHGAREAPKKLAQLDPKFREALQRYGIGEADWDLIRNAQAFEPRPNARLIRAMDVEEGGTPAHRSAGEKWARLINTEMDHAVIETDPLARAFLFGESRPGTVGGEVRRAVGMYRQFPVTFVTLHFARAFARGFDGTRMAHAGMTVAMMTMLGALAMNSKQLLQGRDPLSLDPTSSEGLRAWGAAMLQGGGLGVFGDILFVDKTRYGNTWASVIAGPQFAAVESVLGDFMMKNLMRAAKGEETQFVGDALFVASRYMPGQNLWWGRLAFRRAIVDQLALMLDDRTRDRFRRVEREARRNWNQDFWWQPGEALPDRAPALVGAP